MDLLIASAIICYLLGSAGYTSYLFTRKNIFQKMGLIFVVAGFALQTALIAARYYKLGYMPVQNLHDTLNISAWATAGSFLIMFFRYGLKVLGVYAAYLALILSIAGACFPAVYLESDLILKSVWFSVHIITVFIGEATLALAFGIGILYLIQENAIKNKKRGFFYKRLPSLELLDTTGYACIAVGFTTLTLGLVSGIIYAKLVWGRFWSWDPKEVWAAVSWLIYAALLHERMLVGWRGRRSAILAIVGFCVLLFTFVGVNFFMQGHHGDFTRW